MNRSLIGGLDVIGHIDCVVAIPRSGLVPATLVSLYRNVELFTSPAMFAAGRAVHGTTRRPRRDRSGGAGRRVLVVDDSCNTGSSLRDAVAAVRCGDPTADVTTMVVYATSRSADLVDHWCEIVDQPRVFEWNLLHHPKSRSIGFDLDGIFCPDPPDRASTDDATLEEYYRTAPMRVAPTYRLGAVISSRSTRFEGVTRDWLEEHDVEYDDLILFPGTGAARRALGLHAAHKARHYTASGLDLFVESDPSQAYEIQRLTGRPVICWSENVLLQSTLTSARARSAPVVRSVAERLRRLI